MALNPSVSSQAFKRTAAVLRTHSIKRATTVLHTAVLRTNGHNHMKTLNWTLMHCLCQQRARARAFGTQGLRLCGTSRLYPSSRKPGWSEPTPAHRCHGL
mmetsp:Transcript_62346/g.123217  ORF Transcript_62346/g.123217 Transcript_62346/m.123217 type:complete len:100 (-) Transcript_62346:506-805(-)